MPWSQVLETSWIPLPTCLFVFPASERGKNATSVNVTPTEISRGSYKYTTHQFVHGKGYGMPLLLKAMCSLNKAVYSFIFLEVKKVALVSRLLEQAALVKYSTKYLIFFCACQCEFEKKGE